MWRYTKDKIKKYDRFPKTINFTYKNREKFTTLAGGMTSICIYIAVGITSIILLRSMIRKTVSSATQTFVYKDLAGSQKLYDVDINNGVAFSFGLFIHDNTVADETIGTFILSYVVEEGIPQGDTQTYEYTNYVELEVEL